MNSMMNMQIITYIATPLGNSLSTPSSASSHHNGGGGGEDSYGGTIWG